MLDKFSNVSTPIQDLNELTQYLKTPFDMSMYSDENPINVLEWWSSKENIFPVLTKMVKEVFSIPMSTIASESAFSMAKLQYTQRRSRLTTSAIEVCVAIKDWTAAEHRMQDQETLMEAHQKDMFDNLSDIEDDVLQEELAEQDAEENQEEDIYESEDELPDD